MRGVAPDPSMRTPSPRALAVAIEVGALSAVVVSAVVVGVGGCVTR